MTNVQQGFAEENQKIAQHLVTSAMMGYVTKVQMHVNLIQQTKDKHVMMVCSVM